MIGGRGVARRTARRTVRRHEMISNAQAQQGAAAQQQQLAQAQAQQDEQVGRAAYARARRACTPPQGSMKMLA